MELSKKLRQLNYSQQSIKDVAVAHNSISSTDSSSKQKPVLTLKGISAGVSRRPKGYRKHIRIPQAYGISCLHPRQLLYEGKPRRVLSGKLPTQKPPPQDRTVLQSSTDKPHNDISASFRTPSGKGLSRMQDAAS